MTLLKLLCPVYLTNLQIYLSNKGFAIAVINIKVKVKASDYVSEMI